MTHSFLLLILVIIVTFCLKSITQNYSTSDDIFYFNRSETVKENFFVIDSNNLEKVSSHMYGFTVSKKGILTDNYYKKLGFYEEPEPQGVYVLIRKMGEEIRIHQDFYGSFGLYLFEDKETGYFAISNSFLLLEEYLVGKHKFSLNKEFAIILSFLPCALLRFLKRWSKRSECSLQI